MSGDIFDGEREREREICSSLISTTVYVYA